MKDEKQFKQYCNEVNAHLIIKGADLEKEGWPDEEEIKIDFLQGKSAILCAEEFFKNWNKQQK
jgi:hypothetical protein